MKLLDQFLVNDQNSMLVGTLALALATILIVISIMSIRNRGVDEFKKDQKFIFVTTATLFASVAIAVLSFSNLTVGSQIGKVGSSNLLTNSVTFNVQNGEKVTYSYNRFNHSRKSSNETLVKGLTKVMGRYDFEYIESIDEIANDTWEVSFKCDCGKVKTTIISAEDE